MESVLLIIGSDSIIQKQEANTSKVTYNKILRPSILNAAAAQKPDKIVKTLKMYTKQGLDRVWIDNQNHTS